MCLWFKCFASPILTIAKNGLVVEFFFCHWFISCRVYTLKPLCMKNKVLHIYWSNIAGNYFCNLSKHLFLETVIGSKWWYRFPCCVSAVLMGCVLKRVNRESVVHVTAFNTGADLWGERILWSELCGPGHCHRRDHTARGQADGDGQRRIRHGGYWRWSCKYALISCLLSSVGGGGGSFAKLTNWVSLQADSFVSSIKICFFLEILQGL